MMKYLMHKKLITFLEFKSFSFYTNSSTKILLGAVEMRMNKIFHRVFLPICTRCDK